MLKRSVRDRAIHLLRQGISNAEVSRLCGVPYGTIGHWKHIDRARRGETTTRRRAPCLRCHGDPVDEPAYVCLLGLYLGDGHILAKPDRTPHLQITCDNSRPALIAAAEDAIRRVLPANKSCRVRRTGCQDVKVYSNHLVCLFPQHGPGKKHERPIVLEQWQQDLVDRHPWELLRGLIHSDGCRITNWATRAVAGEVRRYEYPRYFFTNTSADIVRLFTDTLDAVGVEWKASKRASGAVNVSVARRAAVALLDAHVGPKG